MVTENIPAYFTSWSLELKSRANQVRDLIGEAHWLSDGTHKEFLVAEFLRRYLPDGLSISRGFIRSLATRSISREVDLLISDPRLHVPIFNQGGLVIAPPSSIIATIEVKSTYRKSVLKSALANVRSARAVVAESMHRCDIWSGVVFVTGVDGLTEQQMLDDLCDLLASESNAGDDPDVPADAELHPAVVVVLDSFVCLLSPSEAVRSIEVRVFAAGNAAGALAFCQLFEHIRAIATNSRLPGELGMLLERIDGLTVNSRTVQK